MESIRDNSVAIKTFFVAGMFCCMSDMIAFCPNRTTAQPQICDICGVLAPSKRSLVVHRLSAHPKPTNTTEKVKAKKRPAELSEPAHCSGPDKKRGRCTKYKCGMCLASFSRRTDLFRHQVGIFFIINAMCMLRVGEGTLISLHSWGREF